MDSVVIEKELNAPIETIWKMWTDPEHFARWYGPPGAEIPKATFEPEVGGKRFVTMSMQTPKGQMTMHFAGEIREIAAPSRLVYTDAMVDENGDALPTDKPGGAPTEVVVELTASGDKTHMTMTHHGVPADSPGAKGWQMAFEKLEACLTG